MAQAPGQGARRVTGLLVGTILAIVLGWSPWTVQPVLAAGPLQVQAATRYTLDPEAGRVHVAIDYRVTNNKPNTATAIYYYRDLSFGIQPEARQVRASDGAGALGVSMRDRADFIEVTVRLRANLYYRRSTTFTLRYDLVGAAPRSESPIRVGRAFSTFGVWAFGDVGRGTVEVRIPGGYETTIEGDDMTSSRGGGGEILRAEPRDPNAFFAIVTSENRDAYEDARLSFDGGIEVVVLSWPEDDEWADKVAETLREGLPALHEKVGLAWPVSHDLQVRERYTPALEGYAGVFFLDDQRIDVSEDLDPITILHEASHAWFNEALFSERWIYEGLAEEYAYRVHGEIDGVDYDPPEAPTEEDEGFVLLNTWRFPVIVRDETDAVELYGYGASSWLMSLVLDFAGERRMTAAFESADGNRTAYPGAGDPETVAEADDWRRFLDLTQPLDDDDPQSVLDAIETFVLAPGSDGLLERRAEARDAYRELLAAGDGWLPPWYVRRPMGEWLFEQAGGRIAEAQAVLALRDQVDAGAATEGLALDETLRTAYEGAQDGLDGAMDIAQQQLDAIAALAAARVKVQAEPDFVAQLGLLDATPPASVYEAARAAFEAGELAVAMEQARAAASIVDRAPALGQERLLVGAGATFGLLVLLVVAVLLLRRRGRGRRPAAAAATADAASLTTLDARFAPVAAPEPPGTVAPEAAVTLGAVPDGPPAPIGEAPPDVEGGATRT